MSLLDLDPALTDAILHSRGYTDAEIAEIYQRTDYMRCSQLDLDAAMLETAAEIEKAADGGAVMSTPTPGPWIVNRVGSRHRIQTEGDRGTLAYMTARPFEQWGNFSHEQISANARLIAAAPELYDALRGILSSDEQNVYGTREVIARARAALARARGES